jgi:SAM-dependent methyltransferase
MKSKQQPEVRQMVRQMLHAHRPVAWEDDISRNTLDDAPFENLPPISTRDASEFSRVKAHVADHLLGEKSIMEFAAKDTYPIPLPVDREGYSPGRDGNYWMSGLADYLKIAKIAKKYKVDIKRYFDFGCATGRVVRHFCAQTDIPEVWGSDINSRHVRWLTEHLPNRVKPIFNHCVPALPIEDNYMDVVSAFSVFTHIDTFETAWIAELRRILKPGGIAYLTVHNEDTWDILRGEINNEENRLVQSVLKVDPSFAQQVLQPLPDKRTVYRFQDYGPYRAQVFHSNNYLQKTWGRFLDVKEILPRRHVRQTVVLLQKPVR